MSIQINIDMPKKCNDCPMHFYEGQGVCSCRLLHAVDDNEELKPWKRKRKDCPLIEVPPHGDLIDRDALMKELEIDDSDDRTGAALLMAVFLEVLKSAPTIIPAEEGE